MWVLIQRLSTHDLVRAAAARRLVRLRSGRVVILVRWPSTFGRVKRYVRVTSDAGKAFTVRTDDIVEVDIPTESESTRHE